MVSSTSFDVLPIEAQRAVRTSVAQLLARLEKLNREQDDALLGRLFVKQGLQRVPVDDTLRGEFYEAARGVRDSVGAKLIAPEILHQVLDHLANYRAERRPLLR
jgi:TRAP-type C4-dicarboxylate transport system substrate-binding protein